LSSAVAAELNTLAGVQVAKALTWGPDAAFYPPAEYPGEGVVAIGRTGRDYVTLARASRMTGTRLTIMSWSEYLEPIRAELDAPNIETVYIKEMVPHSELVPLFARARAIAVPLLQGESLSGLTGVMDALGAGKPLLVTRKPTLDLDVEGLRIGHSIEVGDVDGWARALRAVDSEPARSTEMGRRARALVDEGMNSERFGASIEAIIDRVVAGYRRSRR
jgi:glycosyltransferase involved in cell wall biosynthesis